MLATEELASTEISIQRQQHDASRSVEEPKIKTSHVFSLTYPSFKLCVPQSSQIWIRLIG